MDVQDSSAKTRESNETISIKKEEFVDECSHDCLGVKEEVASICDDEEGYMFNHSFDRKDIKAEPGVFQCYENDVKTTEEDSKCSLGLVNNDDNILEHLEKDGGLSNVSDVQNEKKTGRNEIKLKGKGKADLTEKTNKQNGTGRISRDEIFKNKEYFCSLCQKHYLGRKLFKQHFNVHFTLRQNQYTCHICKYTTSNLFRINRHLLEVHFLQDENNHEILFVCPLCDIGFNYKKELERHMFVHTRVGHLKCGECTFSCTNKIRMASHMSSFHGYPRVLESTRKSEEDNESEFKCQYCSYISKSRGSFRLHIRKHSGNILKCSECSYTCTARGDMQKHCSIHSDERPFVCDGCSKTYKRRSHLLIHFNGKYGCCRGVKKKRKNSRSIKV